MIFCVKTCLLLILLDTPFQRNGTSLSIESAGEHYFLPTWPCFSLPVSWNGLTRAASIVVTVKLTKTCNFGLRTGRNMKFCAETSYLLILLATKFREIRTLQSIGSPGVHCFLPTRPRFSLPVSRKNLARAASSPGMGKLTKKAYNFGFQTGRTINFCVETS